MTKQQKFLFEPTSNLSGGAETLSRTLNSIAAELERLGFPELIDPEQMATVFEHPRAAIERVIVTRAKGEGRTLGGLPMSDSGILAAVQMPDLSFFRGNWKPPEPLWLDLCRFGRIVVFDPGARRYMVDGPALEEKISASGILATPENLQLYAKLEKWVQLSNELAFDAGTFHDKLGGPWAHPHGHAMMSRDLFAYVLSKRRQLAARKE